MEYRDRVATPGDGPGSQQRFVTSLMSIGARLHRLVALMDSKNQRLFSGQQKQFLTEDLADLCRQSNFQRPFRKNRVLCA
jgi:hypothetical protein